MKKMIVLALALMTMGTIQAQDVISLPLHFWSSIILSGIKPPPTLSLMEKCTNKIRCAIFCGLHTFSYLCNSQAS